MRRRQRWGAAVLVAALGLVGLAAVAAEGRPLDAPLSDGDFRLGTGWAILLLGIAFLIGLALVALSLWSLVVTRRNPTPVVRRPRSQLRGLLLAAAALLLLLALGDLRNTTAEPAPPPATSEEVPTEPPAGLPERAPLWPVLVLGGLVVASFVTAVVTGRRRPTAPAFDRPAPASCAVEAFDTSLDALVDHPDPRTAIVAAYRALLAGLADAGLARRPSEAPHEHLRRALHALDVRPEPMHELLALYDEARFSEHALTATHRARALAAFAAARDDLRVPAR